MTIATGAPALPRAGLTRQAAGLRLVWLHLLSRRVPVALIALAVCGAVLRAALVWHWGPGSGNAALQLPALFEIGTAAVIAVTTYSPFGEPERATGRWLPWLRLGTALGLTAAAIGLLGAGAAGESLPGGILAIVRNVAGAAGIGLLLAAVIGGALAWIGPMAYLVIAEVALLQAWTSPWTWPARPPHDRGAAICAALVFAAGITITAVRGARDSAGD
ncbi:MAG: hypothetical protein JO345_14405 [Streptosporangiaceae bacterium]|nr:hypothetical protein [Streptosporangiaceae bacterium]